MPILNPFLRALFQSSVLGQALTSQHYVLLVPTTDSLIHGRDRETGKFYSELVEDEDFLGCHILRIAPGDSETKDSTNIREIRTKPKTYTTVNGRTVVVKESVVFTNKGFKNVSQAQLLNDAIHHSPANSFQQWLVIYISKPLTGSFEHYLPPPALFGDNRRVAELKIVNSDQPTQPQKKDIHTFSDLLNHFPMIARQMQPGLERLFNEFGKELGKPLPPPPSRPSAPSSLDGTTVASDGASIKSNGSVRLPFSHGSHFEDEEDLMRWAFETAVTAAIDLFQGVDKQQLSFLGATTELTGPAVEKLIERYVAESVHGNLLFPRLCAFHRAQDKELDRRIRQMECIDVSQVGIALDENRDGKREVLGRIDKGITAFRKMGNCGSPQQMLEVLLETQKVISEPLDPAVTHAEKTTPALTINADVLVSLLLLVVIRSQTRHLQARLSYMQRFIYIDDVESGEIGYALSTLEAVLTYLSIDSGGLRKASKQNETLWEAVKTGNVIEIMAIFEGNNDPVVIEDNGDVQSVRPRLSRASTRSSISTIGELDDSGGNLAHVFPFQSTPGSNSIKKRKKRVQMDSRSMSISSNISGLSRTATLESTLSGLSGLEGDFSMASLARTQDSVGNSVLMMAIESQQPASLKYLLVLSDHYPSPVVLSDTSNEGTTLLSSAIQIGNVEVINIILDFIRQATTTELFQEYIMKADNRGRTAAHYLFNSPELINRLADVIPWRMKDKIGHTPLFAICRTYDHAEYSRMVSDALVAARCAQPEGGPLRVSDHTDLKGTTLLHIINDPNILHRVLVHCDADVNAMNERKFTPLMLASKYGRVDMVRIFFGDARVDLHLREARGLTAVELARDDEVRSRIDDLTLFSDNGGIYPPDPSGRLTSIVRSYFVEDGSTRYIVKSGAPITAAASSTTYTITTSRRTIQDFVNLAKWLLQDSPASYMPNISATNFRSPFQLRSRPSRAILYDHQIQLDNFLKILMSHPTFSQHEMLWEFFLVPDMQPEQMKMRAELKAEYLREQIADDYEPVSSKADLEDVESMVAHSRDIVRRVNVYTRGIVQRGYVYAQAVHDVAEAFSLASGLVTTLAPPSTTLPRPYVDAFTRFAAILHVEPASLPLASYINSLGSFQTTISAISTALTRPSVLVSQIKAAQKSIERHRAALLSNSTPRKGLMNIQLPGMEESRIRFIQNTEKAILMDGLEIEKKGRELRYTQEVVVGELAGWTSWREGFGRGEIKRLARMSIIRERERLRGMDRVLRELRESKIQPAE